MNQPASKRSKRLNATHVTPPAALVGRTDLADELASPLLVEALAAAIVQYGRIVRPTTDCRPLDVYDLAPGQGVLAVRLLRALQRLRNDEPTCRRVRLHLCASRVEVVRMAARHALLRLALERGEVTRSRWDPRMGHAPAGQPPTAAVFIALGYFQQLPVQLGAAHYGQWLDAEPERAPRDEQGDWPLTYRLSPRSAEPDDVILHGLRQLYLAKLGSTAVNLPHVGMRVLRGIARRSGGRYLLLAADSGAACMRDIETGALVPPACWRNGMSTMPVNFHALARMQPRARTAHLRSNSEGPLLHIALAGEADDTAIGRIGALLGEGADHSQAVCDLAAWLAPEAPLAMRLAHLRRCAFDPRALLHPPANTDASEPPNAIARVAWRDALERCWVLARDESDPAVGEAVGLWAAYLGLWGLAVRILQPAAAHLAPLARDYLALAQLHTGDLDAALTGMAAESAAPLDASLHTYLQACRDIWAQLPWYRPALARDNELALQPLAAHHAPAWLEQYRDPHIGIMTRLPELPTLEATQAWIARQQADSSRAAFAVVHREYGFVGSVCYQRGGDSGYFHFWMGTDYQGSGIGRRAGQLVCAQAAACGVQRLFTSVYPDNHRSRAALATLGFEPMEVHAVAPDDDLLFLRRGLVTEARDAWEPSLAALLAVIGSPIQLVDAADGAARSINHKSPSFGHEAPTPSNSTGAVPCTY